MGKKLLAEFFSPLTPNASILFSPLFLISLNWNGAQVKVPKGSFTHYMDIKTHDTWRYKELVLSGQTSGVIYCTRGGGETYAPTPWEKKNAKWAQARMAPYSRWKIPVLFSSEESIPASNRLLFFKSQLTPFCNMQIIPLAYLARLLYRLQSWCTWTALSIQEKHNKTPVIHLCPFILSAEFRFLFSAEFQGFWSSPV